MSETIAAIATASGNGSISILRVSGPEAVCVVDEIFVNADLSGSDSHTIHYGWIGKSDEERIDEVLVLLMRAPRSYTAEDVVEIHCHGGGQAAKKILELLIEKGVRLAKPGEFTKRAFLNGRIDLTQAESVMEVIRAKSDLALSTAEEHLRGDIRDEIRDIREVVLSDMAYLEAALDDPEHIELDEFPKNLSAHLDEINVRIDKLVSGYENGRRISDGIRTVIIGRPNVGKSSFLNCILREDRAIVTDVPGTTRDTLEEDAYVGGVRLRLIDTAGIRETSDLVENIGVKKAMDAIEVADFIICVLDSSEKLTEEDREVLHMCKKKPSVILLNKSDLSSVISADDIGQIIEINDSIYSGVINESDSSSSDNVGLSDCETNPYLLEFSAATGAGLSELENLLSDLFLNDFYSGDDRIKEPILTSLRQKELLAEAKLSIDRLFETIESGMPEDLLTVDLLALYEKLGSVTGDTMEDDLVDKIFSDFCMGK